MRALSVYTMSMPEIIVVAHNIRSSHNVGSIFRTAEGFGVRRIILSGYTPYPTVPHDTRLPHIRDKITQQIRKTALDAEGLVPYEYCEVLDVLALRRAGYHIAGLEQTADSVMISQFHAPDKLVLILGEEVNGIPPKLQAQCDTLIEIPMIGQKESFNVSVAAGIALFSLTSAR